VANLVLSKMTLGDPAYAGGEALFQLVVSNSGPSDATLVVVTDTLPAGLTYSGGDAACAAAGQVVSCSIGTVSAGGSRTLLLRATVDSGIADGTVLSNNAVAASPVMSGTATAGDTVTVLQPAGGEVDLGISKTGPVTATAGELVTYTLVVNNGGPATALDVQVVDALPNGLSYVRASSSQGLCQSGVSCQLGELALNASATVTVVALVAGDVPSGTVVTNLAQVNSANPETDGSDNSSSAVTTVNAEAQLTVVKDGPAAVAPNGQVVYRIVVRNSGPSDAAGVTVSDILPASLNNVTVVSSQGGCTGFPCELGDVAAGAAATVQVIGTVASDASGVVTNTATVTSSTALAAGSVVSDTTVAMVGQYADLAVAKSATPTVAAGERITYVVTVQNLGPSVATNVRVTDTLPAGTTFATATGTCSESGGTVICTAATLAAGSTVSYTIVVTASPALLTGVSLDLHGDADQQRAVGGAVGGSEGPVAGRGDTGERHGQ
jgi:uncharacterized repeat protein (TIGR01451 family)